MAPYVSLCLAPVPMASPSFIAPAIGQWLGLHLVTGEWYGSGKYSRKFKLVTTIPDNFNVVLPVDISSIHWHILWWKMELTFLSPMVKCHWVTLPSWPAVDFLNSSLSCTAISATIWIYLIRALIDFWPSWGHADHLNELEHSTPAQYIIEAHSHWATSEKGLPSDATWATQITSDSIVC